MYRINILLKQNQKLFHTRDLAILWSTDKPNTLYTTIKRYVQKGILIPVQKGLYATASLDTIDPYLLGLTVLHSYAYVSCETILRQAGIIFQAGESITMVSSVTRQFVIGGHTYRVRKMADRHLFHDEGIDRVGSVLTASPWRAIADMLYFNPINHFDNSETIQWLAV